jgi:hypothetical protein
MDSAARKLTHGLVILAWYGMSMSMAWVHRVVLRVDVGGCVFATSLSDSLRVIACLPTTGVELL